MKILFYGAKDYDQQSFDRLHPDYPEIEIAFIEAIIIRKPLLFQQDMMESVLL